MGKHVTVKVERGHYVGAGIMRTGIWICIFIFFGNVAEVTLAAGPHELQIKRKGPFAFAKKPEITKKGDRVTIRFTTKGYCDATVAIEDGQGRIVRHLVSGVLGENAPAPFKKGTLEQAVIWDGKDDQGHYIDDLQTHVIRVSLGLKPQLERSLYWSPKKRYGSLPIMSAAPEGVYLYDGKGVDFIRLFDHEGQYLRTIYPFPRKQLEHIKGLDWYKFPQGYRLPRKGGLYQLTLLNSGAKLAYGKPS